MTIQETTRFQTIVQFIKFGLVGASGTLINLAILYVLTEYIVLDYVLVLPFSYLLGITNNFYWNRKYTFVNTNNSVLHEYFKFILSMLLGAISYISSVIILTEIGHIWYFFSAILALVVSTTINFLFSKLWVFKPYKLNIVSNEPEISKGDDRSILLVVSALNEEKNIIPFTESLLKALPSDFNLRLLLIDNGSKDKTYDEICLLQKSYSNIISLHRDLPLDYSNSIREAIKTQPLTYDYIGWAWSDNQITGDQVARVLEIVMKEKPKFTKVFRYEKDYSFWRKVQSFFFNLIISVLFSGNFQDINGCPKIIESKYIPLLDLQGDGWFIDAETVIKLNILIDKSEMVYVPVSFNKRMHGKSKTKWFTALELLDQILIFRFLKMKKWKTSIKSASKQNLNN